MQNAAGPATVSQAASFGDSGTQDMPITLESSDEEGPDETRAHPPAPSNAQGQPPSRDDVAPEQRNEASVPAETQHSTAAGSSTSVR